MIRKSLIALSFAAMLAASPAVCAAQKDSTETASTKGRYEKTFIKDKNCRTASCEGGLIKFHLASKKLYMELDTAAIGRRMLLSSTVSEVSDPEILPVGYKPVAPLYVRFMRPDSLVVNLCQMSVLPDYDASNPALEAAVRRTALDKVLESFPLYCESPDGSALVFDVTAFFNGSNQKIGPVVNGTSGYVSSKYTLKKEADLVTEIKAFKDNASVRSSHSYTLNQDMMGLVSLKKDELFTVNVTRTLLFLPEEKMQSRKADSRLGIFLSNKRELSAAGDAISNFSVIHRWNISPSDTAAYLRGEQVEPLKHIVFYLDNAFPAQWRESVRRGALRWNSAFEEIGFKNVISVLDFPDDDPEFDPDNLKYSCIRYVPSTVSNAMGPSWVDPQSGEIVSASVIVYNDVVKLASGWRFVQTSQLDERARLAQMPQDLFEETMEYVVAHEVGHCLGFMHNMSASAAFPTDSLRSASFTEKYGTTASIMDYARFNYVAQPEDKGVSLGPPFLGPYDRFLIKYAYSYIPEDADATVEKWVDEKQGDPLYRYGRQQLAGRYDPSAREEDLGDDPIKSSEYGIKNLKYILGHFAEWMPDSLDTDGHLKQDRYDVLVKQYGRYLNAVMANVGGIYLSAVKAGGETVVPLDASKQRESLLWVLDQIDNLDWLSADAAACQPRLAVDKADVLAYNTASDLFTTWENVVLCSYIAGEGGYSLSDWMKDIDRHIWKGSPDRTRMTVQKLYVWSLITNASRKTSTAKVSSSLVEDEQPLSSDFGPAGYNWQSKVNTKAVSNSRELFYGELKTLRRHLASKSRTCADSTKRAHYRSLVRDIDAAL